MSRFMSERHAALEPYTPGEQPRDMQYVKLNTNESPFPPSPAVREAAAQAAGRLNLYCDPTCLELRQKAAALYGLGVDNVLPVNGSDEILYFAFLAFCDETHPIAFPDITYGFYPVYASLHHIPARVIPLRDDFTVDAQDYCGLGMNIVLANPNAPTGIPLGLDAVEEIVRTNPDNLVVIDEAYVDFGGESCVGLIQQYDNLLVTQTFSKSRSLAGARLGFGLGCESLINDLNTIKYSMNPYNVNSVTQQALQAQQLSAARCREIVDTRAYTAAALEELGFEVLPSASNFLFAQSPDIPGGELYRTLKDHGVLIRHFDIPRIENFNRITVGTREQGDILLGQIRAILRERSR